MSRLKLPAYGKRLLIQRRAGIHPLDVALVYGDRWWDAPDPRVAIDPKDYEVGKFDFHVLAGLRVTIHDQLGASFDADPVLRPPSYGKFYDLLHEVAAANAYVVIRWPKNVDPRETELLQQAFGCRWWSRELRSTQWPRWWNDDLNERQLDAAVAWLVNSKREAEHARAAA